MSGGCRATAGAWLPSGLHIKSGQARLVWEPQLMSFCLPVVVSQPTRQSPGQGTNSQEARAASAPAPA